MISHLHQCVFVHVPKTAGKTVLTAFGLPELGKDYDGGLSHIEMPYGHHAVKNLERNSWYAEYFSFAFVRNPWDRIVSAFFYLDAGGANESDAAIREKHLSKFQGNFEAFVAELPSLAHLTHFRPQSFWLTNAAGDIGVSFLGRFETFAEDFNSVTKKLGLEPPDLHRRNTSRHADYRQYYGSRQAELVAQIYADDIVNFGYEFDPLK